MTLCELYKSGAKLLIFFELQAFTPVSYTHLRLDGMSYSQLMGALHKAGIEINSKVLADLAVNNPEAFKAIHERGGRRGDAFSVRFPRG